MRIFLLKIILGLIRLAQAPATKSLFKGVGLMLLVIGGLALALIVESFSMNSTQKADEARINGALVRTPPAQVGPWQGAPVDLRTLLNAYQNNELAADHRYKGYPVEVSGVVRAVAKDILGKPYVVIGTTEAADLRAVQCLLVPASVDAATRLNVGEQATVRGIVRGLMLNVLVEDCRVQ